MTFTKPVSVVPRNRWGQPMVRQLNSDTLVAYKRCTSFIDVLEDKYGLSLWCQRNVAQGMALRPALVTAAAAAKDDAPQLNKVVEQAKEAVGASDKATQGTALHAITEQIDRGEDPVIPPSSWPDIDAYKEATKDLRMVDIELFVVQDELQVGGTFDRLVEFDGKRYLADIKTGRIDYGASKIAMQLALYSRSFRYDPDTGQRSSLDVDQTRGLVIHLPAGAGECSLKWADLTAGWDGVQLAAEVWRWRSRRGLLGIDPPGVPDLHGLISLAGDEDSLRRLWAAHRDRWTDELTATAKQRLTELQTPSPVVAA